FSVVEYVNLLHFDLCRLVADQITWSCAGSEVDADGNSDRDNDVPDHSIIVWPPLGRSFQSSGNTHFSLAQTCTSVGRSSELVVGSRLQYHRFSGRRRRVLSGIGVRVASGDRRYFDVGFVV